MSDDDPKAEICEPLLPCPTCGKAVGFTLGLDGEPIGIVHELPMCKDFDERDAGDYLTWLNEHYAQKIVDDKPVVYEVLVAKDKSKLN